MAPTQNIFCNLSFLKSSCRSGILFLQNFFFKLTQKNNFRHFVIHVIQQDRSLYILQKALHKSIN